MTANVFAFLYRRRARLARVTFVNFENVTGKTREDDDLEQIINVDRAKARDSGQGFYRALGEKERGGETVGTHPLVRTHDEIGRSSFA